MTRRRLATVWLSGCSGCHMSILNLHAGLFELLTDWELVYSPLADVKEFPCDVDCVLVEGAVANGENRELAELLRRRSATVISLGDCAVNGNVSALRNPAGCKKTLEAVYVPSAFTGEVTALEARVLPLHQVIRVDAYLPGCPPESAQIAAALQRLFPKH